jgi:hypothetical protein
LFATAVDGADRCQAVKAADGALQPGALQPGLLISYKKDDKHILALVEAPDGKKNWWIVDQVCILARYAAHLALGHAIAASSCVACV